MPPEKGVLYLMPSQWDFLSEVRGNNLAGPVVEVSFPAVLEHGYLGARRVRSGNGWLHGHAVCLHGFWVWMENMFQTGRLRRNRSHIFWAFTEVLVYTG